MVHLWFHLIPKKQIIVNCTVIFIIEVSSFLLPVIKEGCNTHTHTCIYIYIYIYTHTHTHIHLFHVHYPLTKHTYWSTVLPLSKVKCPRAMGIFLTLCSVPFAYFSFCWLHDLFDPVILVQVSMLSSGWSPAFQDFRTIPELQTEPIFLKTVCK